MIFSAGPAPSLQNPASPASSSARAHRCSSFLSFFNRSRRVGGRTEPLPPPLADIGSALTGQQPVPPALGAYLKTWVEPADPFRIVGPIYYVGTKGLAAYLITTPAGHILLDRGMPENSAEGIENSIHKLGFDPRDIKFC